MSRPLALVIDDEPDLCELLALTLDRMQIDTQTCGDITCAKSKLRETGFDLCLTDMRLPDGDGLELIEWMQATGIDTPVAVITAHGNVETAVRALKLGAPTAVQGSSTRVNKETYPLGSMVTYYFPARDAAVQSNNYHVQGMTGVGAGAVAMPPVKVVWYDGGLRPPRPRDLPDGVPMGDNGRMLVGDDGFILGNRIFPDSGRETDVPKTIPRVQDHHQEWAQACKGGHAPGSNFDWAGPLAEAGLRVVGVEAGLVGGECPYWGCIPSKMMIRAANALAEARRIDGLAGSASVVADWAPVAARIREQATDDWNDQVAVDRFVGKGGIFVRGRARLDGPGQIGRASCRERV